jgi:hypothetical protein
VYRTAIKIQKKKKRKCSIWKKIYIKKVYLKKFNIKKIKMSNEALLGLYKFISDYLPYLEKNKYIFQYHSKKSLN